MMDTEDMEEYREIFGQYPEVWREPLGALLLTLATDVVDIDRARIEARELSRVLNEFPH